MRPVVRALALLAVSALPTPAKAQSAAAQPVATERVQLEVTTFASGLVHPWGLAFLPDGRMLVTERPGRLRLVSREGRLSEPLGGLPRVYAQNQGGLLDVTVAPDFASTRQIFFCFAEAGAPISGTALARGRLAEDGSRLNDVQVIFRQQPKTSQGLHYGCRIVFARDGNLFLTVGDHFIHRDQAQNLGSHLGKVIRLRPDGSVPPDNPFVGRAGARPEIWSYGHRNVQGAALHPVTGQLWTAEHGARGGDEINHPQAGLNYGWPVITYGVDYSGARIGEGTAKAGMEQPVHYWDPSIAPSGAAFVTGDLFPQWRGNLLVGALAGQLVSRLEIEGDRVVHEERILHGLGERIRDVRMGPDGAVYLVTDSDRGRILRVAPAR